MKRVIKQYSKSLEIINAEKLIYKVERIKSATGCSTIEACEMLEITNQQYQDAKANVKGSIRIMKVMNG